MKGISVSLVAVAMTMMVSSSLPMPCAAQPSPKVAGRKPIPRWYYYDQLGMREWLKGDKHKALNYFDQSYKMAKADIGTTKVVDSKTKSMAVDVINHQQFHLLVWNTIPESVARSTNPRVLATSGYTRKVADDERSMAHIAELETFAGRVLGKNHRMVQHMARSRNLNMTDAQKRLYIEKLAKGKPTLGTVIAPKWYKQNERDFSPELFTKSTPKGNPRYKDFKSDVTRVPEITQEDGISYTGGVRHDTTKVKPPGDGKTWGSRTTVGTLDNNNNPKAKRPGWGNADEIVDPNLADATKWGVRPDDIMKLDKTKKKTWGASPNRDPIRNKQWGGSNGTEDSSEGLSEGLDYSQRD